MSRQGCVGVINNIGALTKKLVSCCLIPVRTCKSFISNANGHLGMLCAVDTLTIAHLNCSYNTAWDI